MEDHAMTAPNHAGQPAFRATPSPAARRAVEHGGIAWWLWVLLVGSLVFFAVVRVYVRHQEARMAAPLGIALVMQTSSPSQSVRAGALDLAWDEVPGARGYRLTVTSITGQIVVNTLPVDGTEWIPPDDALPALVRGEYLWFVEALDEQGTVMAKSAQDHFSVL
jgi:hypothetical protein